MYTPIANIKSDFRTFVSMIMDPISETLFAMGVYITFYTFRKPKLNELCFLESTKRLKLRQNKSGIDVLKTVNPQKEFIL